MLKHTLLLLLFVVFSCNSTTKNQTKGQVAKDECTRVLTADEITQIKQKINADYKTARIDSIFQRKYKLGGFNGTVLIAQQGVVLYRKAFGFADIRNKDTLLPESKFQLASLSKTFTAVATLKLVQEGKISLEDSVKKFIPEFPYSGIQIKSLLSHRSGLPNYAYVLTDSVRKVNKFPSNADIVRWYCCVKPKLYNTPNRYFSYSNTNFSLLASIIERVSGLSFENYLKKNIFQPLGMKNTFLVTTTNDSININRTVGHQFGGRLPKDNFDDVVGDKGVYSTTDDLMKWYQGLANNCILKPETTKEAFTPRSFEKHGVKNYGYGFRMHADETTHIAKYVYHTGWWKGYNTLMWFSPKSKFVIIVLSNKYNRGIYQIKELLEILEGRSSTEDIETDMQMVD
jgi:CubicO group peptidase (beta-lactamase class C family)